MNIYKLERPDRCKYDGHDSVVVVAETEDEARQIQPNGEFTFVKYFSTWVPPEKVIVTLIGTAIGFTTKQVICASFNVG